METILENLRWDARYTKQDLIRLSHVSSATVYKMLEKGLSSVPRLHGEAVVRVLSERLLALDKISEPLEYETLRAQENDPDRIAC